MQYRNVFIIIHIDFQIKGEIKIEIYSHSKLATFEQCPKKFEFKYIKKIKPDFEQSIEAFLGSKIHEILEWIYNNPEENNNLDNIIKKFIESWNKDYTSNIKIIREGTNIEIYFNKGIKFLINYFLKNTPFKDNTIHTEKKIYVSLDQNGEYFLVGYIDRLVHNKETNIFEIHDYKTGSLKSQEELDEDRQLALYSIGIRETFKNANNIRLVWHFLDSNKELVSERTIEQLIKLKNEILSLIKRIKSTKEFSTNKSNLCNWCEYKTKCPEFNKENLKRFI